LTAAVSPRGAIRHCEEQSDVAISGALASLTSVKGRMPYHVYILLNLAGTTLYTGVTTDLLRRVQEHRDGMNDGFTKRNRVNRLVYFEQGDEVAGAIEREEQIKAGGRQKKLDVIKTTNPTWRDLFDDLLG
jgi:putative endonuclease